MSSKPDNLEGRKFGRLKVVEEAGRTKYGNIKWLCTCICGSKCEVSAADLKSGHTKSCGCLRRDSASFATHGDSRRARRAPEYVIWCAMKSRCSNPNNPGYKNYGGRGIKVCRRWFNYENFFGDMGRRPSPRHTIERVDNEKGYNPDNCSWAPKEVQSRNRRLSRVIHYKRRAMTLSEWARHVGLKRTTLRRRLDAGWEVERALITPA
jgi:hypothetical protein